MTPEWTKQRAFEFDWIMDGFSRPTRVIHRRYPDGNVRSMCLTVGHPRYDTSERIEQAFSSVMDRPSPKLYTEEEFNDFFSRDMQARGGTEVVDGKFYLRLTFSEASRSDWDAWQELQARIHNPIGPAMTDLTASVATNQ